MFGQKRTQAIKRLKIKLLKIIIKSQQYFKDGQV